MIMIIMATIPTIIIPIMIITIIGYLYNIYNDSPVGGIPTPLEKYMSSSVGIIDHQAVVSSPRCSQMLQHKSPSFVG